MQKRIFASFLITVLVFFTVSSQAETPPSSKSLLAKGDVQFENGNHLEALALYNQAFFAAPDSLEANYKLGQAAAAVKDFEKAVMAFERVIIIDPNFVQAKIEMAKSFYNLGATETAKQYFREALEANLPEEVRASINSFLTEID